MRTFDASSIIYAWDNYPPDQFPPLWKWIAREIAARSVSVPQVALDEVEGRSPECANWLRERDVAVISVSNDILQEALRIKTLLGIEGDRYHPKGVNENDILIIATARVEGLELISNESLQNKHPDVPAKARIPTVCKMQSIDVTCMDFLSLLKTSGQVFGS